LSNTSSGVLLLLMLLGWWSARVRAENVDIAMLRLMFCSQI
jgi:hypothetical protein